jgi:hypothetical protein
MVWSDVTYMKELHGMKGLIQYRLESPHVMKGSKIGHITVVYVDRQGFYSMKSFL